MLDSIFRLNPIFKITPVEELTEKQRSKFEHITRSKDIYGLLHASSDAKVTVKALNRAMVELLHQFREPKRLADLPSHFTKGPAADVRNLIIRLVLDSVLEIEWDGEYISGVGAVNKTLPTSQKTVQTDDTGGVNLVQALSKEAIEFALQLPLKHPMSISNFLYSYNSLPLCRRMRERFPNEETLAGFLGFEVDSTWLGMPRHIKPKPIERDDDGDIKTYDKVWRFWYLRKPRDSKDRLSFKVYVSPALEDLPEAFRIVRETAAGFGAYSMKIGRKVTEVFRPDRLVVYFYEHGSARDYAAELAVKTKELRCHGVPFTYQVSPDNPIVSMGVDPPKSFGERNSWRGYITENLALAIQGAWRSETETPLDYIRTQMHVLGIHVGEWRPARDDWTVDFNLEETHA